MRIRFDGVAVSIVASLLLGVAWLATTPIATDGGSRVQSSCEGNLRQLSVLATIYADDNGDRYPATLQALLDAYPDVERDLVICPASSDSEECGDCSYRLIDGARPTDGSNTVLIREPATHHDKGYHLAFIDGRVEWIETPR